MQVIRKINQIGYERLVPALIWMISANAIYGRFARAIAEWNWLLGARELSNLIFTLLVVVLFIIRYRTKGKRARLPEALVAIAGTFSPILLAIQPVRYTSLDVLFIGNVFSLIGLIWSIISVVTLGRCFGLFPEARGLVTRGPYRLIRHPLYLGEIVFMVGMLFPVFSTLSLITWIVATFFQVWRAKNEERVLESEFPDYAVYKTRTYRIIPYLW